MSDLPEHVSEAGLLFRRDGIHNDPVALRRIEDWGHLQIDLSYPDSPLRAPLNPIRRKFAHMEWQRVVRTSGRDLRGTIANALIKELEFELQRRQANILADDAEVRRQKAVTFDTRTRIQEHDLTSRIDLENQKNLGQFTHDLGQQAEDQAASRRVDEHRQTSRIDVDMEAERRQLDHDLEQEAQDNASRRRSDELVTATDQQVIVIVTEAVVAAAGRSATKETMETITTINAEVERIRGDSTLTDDDKHLQIKNWLNAIPVLLQQAGRRHD